jgi:DNA-binding NarL/FixJ family response regulator
MLKKEPVDVLLLDISVPVSAEDSNPYPVLHLIPNLVEEYEGLSILVISMHSEGALVRGVMEAGASGYLLKDDQANIRELAHIVINISNGGVNFSQKAYQLYQKHEKGGTDSLLTPRQLEALSLCAAYPNWTLAEVARKMEAGNSTVRNLLSGSYVRLEVRTRAAAVARARELGIITPNAPQAVG